MLFDRQGQQSYLFQQQERPSCRVRSCCLLASLSKLYKKTKRNGIIIRQQGDTEATIWTVWSERSLFDACFNASFFDGGSPLSGFQSFLQARLISPIDSEFGYAASLLAGRQWVFHAAGSKRKKGGGRWERTWGQQGVLSKRKFLRKQTISS